MGKYSPESATTVHRFWRTRRIEGDAERRAAMDQARAAKAKAMRLWPGAHGRVLCEEINVACGQLHWLGPTARTRQLIEEILATPEP